MSKNTDRIYFEHLDVVRFVAAFMIVILHAYVSWVDWFEQVGFLTGGTHEKLTVLGEFGDTFLRNLGLGVDIFFLISGFLITYILIEEKKRLGKINIKKFMIRRTLRIWPLYFLIIAIAPFLVIWMDNPSPQYIPNILFLSNFQLIKTHLWEYPFGHLWSICIEEHFYLVWPFIIAFVPNKRLMPVFVFTIMFSILFRLYSAVTMEDTWYVFYLNTLSRMDVLAIGAVGAYYYAKKPFHFSLNRWVRFALIFSLILGLSLGRVELWTNYFEASFKKFFTIGIFSVLLLDYNFASNFKHILPHKSIFHYLGKISYGIYMYSNIIVLIVIKKFMWAFDSKNFWFYLFLNISLSIIIPIISYELFEKHILKISKRFRMIKTKR